MSHVRRLLDANANRAREAMRVMEDAARFLLDDPALSGALKTLRHDLASALAALGPIAAHRDTAGDVGTTLTTDAEARRGDVATVALAAGKRLSEALRCLEEYAKVEHPDAAPRFETMRYRGYDLEAALTACLALPDPRRWRVCVLITEALCEHHPWLDVARAALEGGADCLQLREKHLEADDLLDRAHQLRSLIHPYPSPKPDPERSAAQRRVGGPAPVPSPIPLRPALILNDRVDLALAAGADGVHLGQHDLPIAEARRIAGRQLLIGASTHNLREARAAVAAGADYCGVGAMFATTTKQRKPSGIDYLKRYLRDFADTPHLTIGGIGVDNIDQVVRAGARAVAVSACVCGAKDPAKVVQRLCQALT